jgi:GlpG protein
MRWLHDFETVEAAQGWADVLEAEGIECSVRQSPGGGYAVWVHDDEQLKPARGLLNDLPEGPGSPQFEELARAGRQRRRQIAREQASRRPRTIHLNDRFGAQPRLPVVTLGLVGISLAVGLVTALGSNLTLLRYFTIDDFSLAGVLGGEAWVSIRQGELWRLISPVFVHFGLLHLVFNLWMLLDLGTALERLFSHWYLLVFVLLLGVVSNLVQYLWTGNPQFGGMSGVIYGLFGFLWFRGRFDPAFPQPIANGTVVVLLLWYLACVVGLIGNVANAAHTAGLLVGMAWGLMSSGRLGRRRSNGGARH